MQDLLWIALVSIIFCVGYHFVKLFLPCCLQCFDAVGWAAGRASGTGSPGYSQTKGR